MARSARRMVWVTGGCDRDHTRGAELAGERKPQQLKPRVSAIAVRHREISRSRAPHRRWPRWRTAGPSTSSDDSRRASSDCALQDDRVWGGERPRCARWPDSRGGCLPRDWLINAEAGEGVFQLGAVDEQAAAGGFYVFHFVEGAEEADFGGGVLFGVAEGAVVGGAPGGDG